MSIILEQQEVLRDFAERLDTLKIPYMLTGSIAMAYYALPRMTADIDIVIETNLYQSDLIIKYFEPDYYIPHGSMRSAISHKTMFNMLHEQTLVKIDWIVRKMDDYQINAFNRRRKVDFINFDVWIISHEDLILAKLVWAKKNDSEMQLRDVTNLLRGTVDFEYLKLWAPRITVDKTLNKTLDDLNNE